MVLREIYMLMLSEDNNNRITQNSEGFHSNSIKIRDDNEDNYGM